MKNILYIYLYANLGGVTSVIKQRTQLLKEKGWAAHGLFMADQGGVADMLNNGLSGVRIAKKGDLVDEFVRMSKETTFDAVTVFDVPQILGGVREAFSGRLIYEVHTPIRSTLLRTQEEDFDAVDHCVVPSDWSKSWILAHYGSSLESKILVVPNRIDRSVFHPSDAPRDETPDDRPEVLWVGKLAPYKRWWDAVRIMGALHKRRPISCKFLTGGALSDVAAEAFLHEIGMCGIFDVSSWIHGVDTPEVAAIYRQAAASGGVLISTSEAESFCLVIHEALSCGLPVVAAAAGPVADLSESGMRIETFRVGDNATAAKQAGLMLGTTDEQKDGLSALDIFESEQDAGFEEYVRLLEA